MILDVLGVMLFIPFFLEAQGLSNGSYTDGCIPELPIVASKVKISSIKAVNGSSYTSQANSVAYHAPSSTVFIAGDFRVTPQKTYAFLQALTYSSSAKSKYAEKYTLTWRTKHDVKFQIIGGFRTWTRMFAHSTLDVVLVTGYEYLKAFNTTTGNLIWNAIITPCNDQEKTVKYDDFAIFTNGL